MKVKLSKEAGGYDLYRIDEDGKRVTFASTQDYKQKLSLKNCQAIERGYDLDELADEYSDVFDAFTDDRFDAFIAGFQKALELMGNKKFSEEDMRKAFGYGIDVYAEPNNCDKLNPYQKLDKLIQSLQQTEWDVEVEMEFNPINHASGLEITGNVLMDASILENYKPKLDANGCLILKIKSE